MNIFIKYLMNIILIKKQEKHRERAFIDVRKI